MSRTYLTIAVIIILLGAGGFWHSHYISQSAQHLTDRLDQVDEHLRGEQWQAARTGMEELKQEWLETRQWWSVLMEHRQMDELEVSLKRSEEFINAKNLTLGTTELITLRLLIDHISDTEILSFQNIF